MPHVENPALDAGLVFYVQNSSAEKKISEGVGMDLNYRPPALQAGFAMFFADPAFFSCPDW